MWRQVYVGATVVVLAVLAVSGQSRLDGPVVLRVSWNHGLHAGDVVVLLVAVVGLAVLASLSRSTRGR